MKILRERGLRDLKRQPGRYIALLLLILLGVTVSTGISAGNESALAAVLDSQERGHVEDGYLTVPAPLDEELVSTLTGEGLQIEQADYADLSLPDDSTLRVYRNRSSINLVSLDSGTPPQNSDDIVLEKLYAKENGISVGDTVDLSGLTFHVSGLGSTPDYSTVTSRASDTSPDHKEFGTAFLSSGGLERLRRAEPQWVIGYSYVLADSDLTAEGLVRRIMTSAADGSGDPTTVASLLKQEDNPRINTVVDDTRVTRQIAFVAGGIALILIAYVLAVLIAESIRRESPVIGTLYALGLTRGELIQQYMMAPMLLAVVSAIGGTAAGIACAPYMQNNSAYYSFPDVHSQVSPLIVAYGLLVPVASVAIVSYSVLRRRLSREPLQLLRRDLGEPHASRIGLVSLPFRTRFRLRGFIRELRTNVLTFTCIVLSLLLLVFSFGMRGSILAYSDAVRQQVPFSYMYIFDRAPSEVPDGAETASVRTVSLTDSSGSDVTFVGLDADSDHFGWDLPDSSPDHVHVSSSLALRRGLSKGDRLSLRTTDRSDHQVIVDGVLRYPGLAVFAQRDRANELFGDQPGAVNAAITDEADDALAAQARTVVDRSEMIRGGRHPHQPDGHNRSSHSDGICRLVRDHHVPPHEDGGRQGAVQHFPHEIPGVLGTRSGPFLSRQFPPYRTGGARRGSTHLLRGDETVVAVPDQQPAGSIRIRSASQLRHRHRPHSPGRLCAGPPGRGTTPEQGRRHGGSQGPGVGHRRFDHLWSAGRPRRRPALSPGPAARVAAPRRPPPSGWRPRACGRRAADRS